MYCHDFKGIFYKHHDDHKKNSYSCMVRNYYILYNKHIAVFANLPADKAFSGEKPE